jgi:hypothetical protein
MVRTLGRLGAIIGLVLPMVFVVAEPAGAVTKLQTCAHVQGTATITPGITPTSTDQVIKAKGSETTCTPSTTTGGYGTLTATIKVPQANCAKLASGGQVIYGVGTSTWHNGTYTKYNLRLTTGTGAYVLYANVYGTITAGRFYSSTTKRHLTGQVKFRVTSGNCTASSPVKSVAFANTKAFVIYY